MADYKNYLLLFFDRPMEPFFMPKGDGKTFFKLPNQYFPDKFSNSIDVLNNWTTRDTVQTVEVETIDPPDLSIPLELPFYNQFSLFLPPHKRYAAKLIEIFMNAKDVKHLFYLGIYCQMRVNAYLFIYAFTVAIINRKDTKGLVIPNFVESFPLLYMDPRVIKNAREALHVLLPKERKPIHIPMDYTASPHLPEQRVAYFREDIGVNLHHWHWHLVYPGEADEIAIVAKDRRGELFYYMHQQIIARYTVERFCNGLGRIRSFAGFREPMGEGYFPKMTSKVASIANPPRFANSHFHALDRNKDGVQLDMTDMEICRDRIFEAIDNMAVILPNQKEPKILDEATGIDVLGDMVESTMLSPNQTFYGSYHNNGHNFISLCHDPDNKYLEDAGVMGDVTTAMRDPMFYVWHKHIDDIFVYYKEKLPPYKPETLLFPGVEVRSVSVQSATGEGSLHTQWERSRLNLERGLDFASRDPIVAVVTHLTNDEFFYEINVKNTNKSAVMGTVRLFMAPVHDDQYKPLTFNEQRKLMIEMDAFTHSIPAGNSIIKRSSKASSVTIPYEQIYNPGPVTGETFDYCGCGWPDYLLLPKGTSSGYPMVVFCMITNWLEDRVDQDSKATCQDAFAYCGLRGQKYPDKRAMGFPFDRSASVRTLKRFLTPNMNTSDCVVYFKNEIRDHKDKA